MRNRTAHAKARVGVLSLAFLSYATVAAEAQYECRWNHVVGGGVGGNQPWTAGIGLNLRPLRVKGCFTPADWLRAHRNGGLSIVQELG